MNFGHSPSSTEVFYLRQTAPQHKTPWQKCQGVWFFFNPVGWLELCEWTYSAGASVLAAGISGATAGKFTSTSNVPSCVGADLVKNQTIAPTRITSTITISRVFTPLLFWLSIEMIVLSTIDDNDTIIIALISLQKFKLLWRPPHTSCFCLRQILVKERTVNTR